LRIPRKLLLALPVLFALYFYGLTSMGVVGPDEPRYAAIGREMAQSGDWITPRLWGQPWFEKPPLLYWLTAAGFRLGLGPELAPRLPVAILSAWFLLFYFFRLRREFGERAAWFSFLMLATSGGWLAYSHVAVTEIPLATMFCGSMLLALPWVRSGGRRGLVFGGVLLGLAVLAKGLVPLVLALPLFWVGRRRWRDLLTFCLTTGAVAAPWYVACYWQNGWPFIDVLFIQHHLGRFVSAELQHAQPWWFYLPVIAGLLCPWAPMLVGIGKVEWQEPRRLLLLLWFAFGLLFFSASTNKLPGYVLPLLPAAAALIGIRMATAPIRFVLPLSVLLMALGPVAAAVLPAAIASGLSRASAADVWWPGVVAAVLCAAGIAWWERRDFPAAMDGSVLAVACGMVWLIGVSFPAINLAASARPLWESGVRCQNDHLRGVRYGLNYYAGRELPACGESGR